MNEVLRTSYVRDCELGLKRWNRQFERAGMGERLALPSPRFHRAIGVWAGVHCDPDGGIIDQNELRRREGEWLPTEADRTFVKSLMRQVIAPGKMAGWIAPPERGISLPIEYEYVHLYLSASRAAAWHGAARASPVAQTGGLRYTAA
jgi:benzoyl-CoA 2,3-dioxygenase component B